MALPERDSAQAAHVQSWIEEADCHCTLYRAVEEFQRGFYHISHDVVRLTRMEIELTAYLFRHRGRIVSREQLMMSVWGKTDALNPRTEDTHISRLRAKLPLPASGHWNLVSIHQRGYRLEEQAGAVRAGR
jgi:DNA-binding response OmpR family regulator